MAAIACYHCGQPVVGRGVDVEVGGEVRQVCCHGCKAVAELISDSGNAGFYESRALPPSDTRSRASNTQRRPLDPELEKYVDVHGGIATAEVFIDGMYCTACASLIEKTLDGSKGIETAKVDPLTHRLTVAWQDDQISLTDIVETVSSLGYEPRPLSAEDGTSPEQDEQRQAIKRLLVASLGMMQVMMFAIGLYAGDAQGIDASMEYFLRLVSLGVATPVVAYSARPFFTGAIRGVVSKQPGMDLPVAIAIGLAYLGSVYSTFTHGTEVWFDSVTMFVFFLTLGRFIELRARLRAAASAEALKPKLPDTTLRLHGDERREVPIASLRRDDIVLLMPGDRVPADGILLDSETSLDEAVLTGESRPQSRRPGDTIPAGAINLDAVVRMRVTETGNDTVLGQIKRLSRSAQLDRPKAVQLADRVASYFITAVLAIAVVVAVSWIQLDASRAFVVTLSVLVVTCPCALALATPTAFAAVLTWLSNSGLLLKNADGIEALARADRVVFDKTGTLTLGRPAIDSVTVRDGKSSDADVLAVAAALERDSRHPLAHAFASIDTDYTASDVRVVPGHGIEGVVDGRRWSLGTHRLVTGKDDADRETVCLGSAGKLVAEFGIVDELRDDAASVIRQLHAMGLSTSLLSGDGETAVRAAADELGIEDAQFALSPEDKLQQIRRWQEAGERVVMIGDGINDAPVLGGADVSITPAHATDVAMARSDLVMLGTRLEPVVIALRASRATLAVVRQNLAWAIIYNTCALPAAAMGLVPTWLAAIGMSASSLLVVMNSLRLSR